MSYEPHKLNGSILSIAKVIKNVMVSATEAKLGTMYINEREAISIRNTLTELGDEQPPTTIIIDNKVTHRIVNKTLK